MNLKMMLVAVVLLSVVNVVSADTFGTGANEFDIDFVTISGDTNPTSGYGIVNDDYRMGKFEITNDQWGKFQASYGTVTGSPSSAYDESPQFTGANVPTNNVSWYEAAQFVNYLNISTGHAAAYKFTSGSFDVWSSGDAGYDTSNPFRNSNSKYFLPKRDERIKAAYWNGTSLQTYATKGDITPTQGDWNFYDSGFATDPAGPWDVGSGSEELNGTFDMMGNILEWMENPIRPGDYMPGSDRGLRCSSFAGSFYAISRASYTLSAPDMELPSIGLRVASVVPEPAYVNIPIDIKPSSCPNPLNIKSKGMLPVSILGSENFDVNEVDVLSIRLAGVMPLRSNYEDVATPLVDAEECDCSTEASDGYIDLTLKFDTQAIVAAIGEVANGDELLLELIGELFDGTQIKGEDCIIVHAKRKIK